MRKFSFSDVNRQPGEVLDAALAAPVTLQKRGRDRLVLLSVAEYERLLAASAATRSGTGRTAHRLDTAPQEDLELLERQLAEILADAPDDD
ncbi:type II toxin-antitoxin system prevent-host-death family antitoxin [Microvirga tunisiensis]|uniref:Antitoxin n=1 Tax=Pannonibacter tanglangensis TaxID=2750084 RepID=A0A7X5F522_9HYPH|nr:type II toxin-antitoxin system prevent-host-death family antitoxin [Pannonibacter sp. XCT-53]NBN79908.1 type II toxin-antitoxin system prevent-host-death family antitoxin [Pannonibacter sp. XCT-53]